MTLQANGNSAKLSWWLIGLVSTIVLGVAGHDHPLRAKRR
jgi:hypothetical protein